ncbi:MAG: hypothetical protein IKG18_01715 [Atopobiaceae bacterium]|nr:hypothetical protein [Atopobiaceae bacterium]MBR4614640.1 hypothetical protein [Kiritimatiellia bacterium]
MKALDELWDIIESGNVCSNFELRDIAHRFEVELLDGWMKLPKGKDGKPFHVGDKAIDYDTERSVVAVTEDSILMDGYESGDSVRFDYACNHMHAKRDQLKELLESYYDTRRELVNHGSTAEKVEEFTADYAKGIREYLKEGE